MQVSIVSKINLFIANRFSLGGPIDFAGEIKANESYNRVILSVNVYADAGLIKILRYLAFCNVEKRFM